MKFFMAVALITGISLISLGLDIKLSTGQVLRNVKVENVSIKGITLLHSDGGTNVRPEQLSEAGGKTLAKEIEQYNQLVEKHKEQVRIASEQRAIQEKASAEQQRQQEEAKRERIKHETENIKKILAIAQKDSTFQCIPALREAIRNNPHAKNLKTAQTLLNQMEKEVKSAATRELLLQPDDILNVNWNLSIDTLKKNGATLGSSSSSRPGSTYKYGLVTYRYTPDGNLRQVAICDSTNIEQALLGTRFEQFLIGIIENFKSQNVSFQIEYYKRIAVQASFLAWLKVPGDAFIIVQRTENMSELNSNSIYIYAYHSKYYTIEEILRGYQPAD